MLGFFINAVSGAARFLDAVAGHIDYFEEAEYYQHEYPETDTPPNTPISPTLKFSTLDQLQQHALDGDIAAFYDIFQKMVTTKSLTENSADANIQKLLENIQRESYTLESTKILHILLELAYEQYPSNIIVATLGIAAKIHYAISILNKRDIEALEMNKYFVDKFSIHIEKRKQNISTDELVASEYEYVPNGEDGYASHCE